MLFLTNLASNEGLNYSCNVHFIKTKDAISYLFISIMFFSCNKSCNTKACKMLLRVTAVSSGLKHINRSFCNTAALCQLHTSNADSVALRKKEEKKVQVTIFSFSVAQWLQFRLASQMQETRADDFMATFGGAIWSSA